MRKTLTTAFLFVGIIGLFCALAYLAVQHPLIAMAIVVVGGFALGAFGFWLLAAAIADELFPWWW